MPPEEMIPVEQLLESYEAALVETQYYHKTAVSKTSRAYNPKASERRSGIF